MVIATTTSNCRWECCFYLSSNTPENHLKIGIYAGSSWDVPNGNDYKVIDTAISRFEKLYPNVEVVYESGISRMIILIG